MAKRYDGMANDKDDLTIGPVRRFARCPKCNELIDAASTSCRYCGSPLTAQELERAAALQTKLTEAKSKANNRAAMVAAIKSLVVVVLIYSLWFLLRFFRGYGRAPRSR